MPSLSPGKSMEPEEPKKGFLPLLELARFFFHPCFPAFSSAQIQFFHRKSIIFRKRYFFTELFEHLQKHGVFPNEHENKIRGKEDNPNDTQSGNQNSAEA